MANGPFDRKVPQFDPFQGSYSYNGTRPIIATQGHLGQLSNGHSVQSSPRFVTRTRQHVAAGKWAALAVVYGNWRRNTSIAASESDAGVADTDILAAGIELVANPITGIRNQSHPNTDGPTAIITFNGSRDVRVQVGSTVVSDWILPSQFGLDYFEFETREQAPWIRTAFASTDRTSGVFWSTQTPITTTTYFQQDFYAVPASDAAAIGLTTVASSGSRITGLTFVNGQAVPTPLCLIGVPLDGQKSVLVLGTSRLDSGNAFADRSNTYFGTVGVGMGSVFTDGPWSTTYLNLPGPVCKWLQDPEVSAPFLQLATGGGNMAINWSGYTGDRPTTLSYEQPGANRRDGHIFMMQFADVLLNEHGVNDSYIGIGGYTIADYKAQMRAIGVTFKNINPLGKYIVCHGPVSATYTTTATALNPFAQVVGNANYSGLYLTALNELVSEGVADYLWDWKPVVGVGTYAWGSSSPLTVFSGITSTGSTTTVIELDGGPGLLTRRLYNRNICRINSEDRFISSNFGRRITLTSALSGAPSNGVTVEIIGNFSHDGLHPSGWGEYVLAQDAKEKLNVFIKPIPRPDTQ